MDKIALPTARLSSPEPVSHPITPRPKAVMKLSSEPNKMKGCQLTVISS